MDARIKRVRRVADSYPNRTHLVIVDQTQLEATTRPKRCLASESNLRATLLGRCSSRRSARSFVMLLYQSFLEFTRSVLFDPYLCPVCSPYLWHAFFLPSLFLLTTVNIGANLSLVSRSPRPKLNRAECSYYTHSFQSWGALHIFIPVPNIPSSGMLSSLEHLLVSPVPFEFPVVTPFTAVLYHFYVCHLFIPQIITYGTEDSISVDSASLF